ncbi:phage tail protein [Burkholderia sp. SRS-W-2-2016]|uniref:tail assembly protein n=1 Tax=Burkholderia sp. SRS-W-2-2016 TaxID=1926878 RepID=UPI00094AA437|nr:tail assembly protein [Burkholderia sp. SRS-W-2-2016]OLL29493.1 phage tail protein [Burkholderia sp. SRS-W-2-2016]
MLQVIFYGDMVPRFGKSYSLDVRSPREALHALMTQIEGLRQYFRDHPSRAFLVRGTHQDYDESDIDYPQASGTLKIVPLVHGAGALGKVLLGAVVAVVGAFTPLSAFLVPLGVSIALGGLAQLLTPRISTAATPEKPENQPSFAFDGAVNTMGQGGPVSLGYGRMVVGGQVISVGFSTNNEIFIG